MQVSSILINTSMRGMKGRRILIMNEKATYHCLSGSREKKIGNFASLRGLETSSSQRCGGTKGCVNAKRREKVRNQILEFFLIQGRIIEGL